MSIPSRSPGAPVARTAHREFVRTLLEDAEKPSIGWRGLLAELELNRSEPACH
jgi:hypothetical protein